MTKKTYKKNVEKQKKANKKPAPASVSPLQMVKERFGSKEKLAQAVADLFAQVKEERENLKERLLTAANTQLLRLHEVSTQVKERFGSKEKLIDHVLTLQNRMKDSGYREKLAGFSLPRLMDLVRRFEKK
jgi:AcrR family transcriptional regulator